MPKHIATVRTQHAGIARFARLQAHARREWHALTPSAVLVALFAALVLLDGLLAIGLLALLEGLGLYEPAIDPGLPPADAVVELERARSAT